MMGANGIVYNDRILIYVGNNLMLLQLFSDANFDTDLTLKLIPNTHRKMESLQKQSYIKIKSPVNLMFY